MWVIAFVLLFNGVDGFCVLLLGLIVFTFRLVGLWLIVCVFV